MIIIRNVENAKEIILKVSKEIAYENGLSKLSMRKVATKCDIALGTIYNYYPTKTDIIIEIVEDFWKECLIGFEQNINEEIDFFKELEYFYIHIKKHLEKFEQNWLHDLSNLPQDNKSKAKKREMDFSTNLVNIIKEIILKHKKEFNDEIFNIYTNDEISIFILNNFMIMLKTNNQSYDIFNFALKKILT